MWLSSQHLNLPIYEYILIYKNESRGQWGVQKRTEKKTDIWNLEQAKVFPHSLSKNRSQPEPNQRLPGNIICKYKGELLYTKSEIKEIYPQNSPESPHETSLETLN